MSGRSGRPRRRSLAADPDIDRALEAMTAPELRAAVRAAIGALDEETRASTIDLFVTRATKGPAGFRPGRPSHRLVEQAQSFVEAASHLGYADPADATEYLRGAMKAFLAGDHVGARAVFEVILIPMAGAEIDLGQHELVEEVLGIDAHICVAQYVASVYTTTPLPERAAAVLAAIEHAQGLSSLLSPIKDMEEVSAGALPDLSAFLPLWVKRLRRFKPSTDEWESDQERWLREAVSRSDGVHGLERLARSTKRPQACLAWCQALADQGDWPAALRAYETAARLVGSSHWRGRLLDGAALGAQELRRTDLPARLENAWRVDPTLTRLLRWLVARGDAPALARATAKKALARCPKKAGRQMGLLRPRRRRRWSGRPIVEGLGSGLVRSQPPGPHRVSSLGHAALQGSDGRRPYRGARCVRARCVGVDGTRGRRAQTDPAHAVGRGARTSSALQPHGLRRRR